MPVVAIVNLVFSLIAIVVTVLLATFKRSRQERWLSYAAVIAAVVILITSRISAADQRHQSNTQAQRVEVLEQSNRRIQKENNRLTEQTTTLENENLILARVIAQHGQSIASNATGLNTTNRVLEQVASFQRYRNVDEKTQEALRRFALENRQIVVFLAAKPDVEDAQHAIRIVKKSLIAGGGDAQIGKVPIPAEMHRTIVIANPANKVAGRRLFALMKDVDGFASFATNNSAPPGDILVIMGDRG